MATERSYPAVVPQTGDEPAPYTEQIKFLGMEKPYYGFISGSGAGKTFAGVYRLWLNAEWWNKDVMGAIIVPDKSQFIDNIKPIMEDFGLMDRWEYNSVYTDEPGLVTTHGERILILSADNQRQIERIKGKNLGYIWMDEEAEIDPRAREIGDQRLRVGTYPNLFITTTPKGKNHTYDFFKGDLEDYTETPYEQGTLIESEDSLAIVGVPSEANPVLDDEDIARMRKRLPEGIVQQEIEGTFAEVGSGILTRDMLNYVDPQEVPDRDMSIYVGVDLGVQASTSKAQSQDSDYWVAAVLGVDSLKNKGYLLDLHRDRGMTLREGVQWLKGIKNQAGNPEFIIESNQSQRFLTQEAESEGLRVTKTYNTDNKEDRLIQLSIPFANQSIQLVDWGDSRFQPLRDEWLAFPEGSHDDTLDAVEIAVSQANLGGGYSMFEGEAYERDERWT